MEVNATMHNTYSDIFLIIQARLSGKPLIDNLVKVFPVKLFAHVVLILKRLIFPARRVLVFFKEDGNSCEAAWAAHVSKIQVSGLAHAARDPKLT